MKPDKPNIFFISSWLPTPDNPHLGNFVVKHAQAISLCCNVYLVNINFHNSAFSRKIKKVEDYKGLICIEIFLTKNNILYNFIPFLKQIKLIYEYLKIFKYVNKQYAKIDITHSNVIFPISVVAFFIKHFFRVPFVVTEHWTGYLDRDPHELNLFKKLITKTVLFQSAGITAVSDELKESIETIFRKSEIQVVPNVVDDIFFKLPLKEKSTERFEFIHISTLDNLQKNVTGIIDAFIEVNKEFENTHLTIVGEKQNKFLIDYISKKTDSKHNIELKFNQKTDEIAELISNSHVLVMFSNYESFSIVLAEALAAGVPVIASKCGGLANILDEKYGFFIKPNDSYELLKSMKEIMVNYEIYDKELLRNFAYKFSYQNVGEQFYNVYRSIIDN